MSVIGLLSIVIPVLVVFLVIVFVVVRKKRPLNKEHFTEKWQAVQKLCSSKATWPLAIINADKLLDEALKKSNFKGKSAGERLADAQRTITNNDSIWGAHKLRNKIVHEPEEVKLTEDDVKQALIAFRQTLKDLEAL